MPAPVIRSFLAAAGRGHPSLMIGLGVLGGMGLRAAADPWLGAGVPFVFAFPAIVLVALLGGATAALATAGLSAIWVVLPWLPPNLAADTAAVQIGTFLFSSLAIAVVCDRVADGDPSHIGDALPVSTTAVRWLRISIVLALLLPTLLFAGTSWLAWRSTRSEALLRLDRSGHSAAEHAARIIETAQVIARQIRIDLEDVPDVDIARRERDLHARLLRIVGGLSEIQSIWVWDALGHPLLSNRFFPAPRALDVSDRSYFRSQRDGTAEWFISERLIGRATQESLFDVSTRRERRDGTFAGAISVSLYPEHFAAFYDDLARAEPGLRVLLFRPDGSIIAPDPLPAGVHEDARTANALSRLISGRGEGNFEGAWMPDGEYRYGSLRHVDPHPLYVLASIDRAAVLRAWRNQVAVLAAFTFPTALGLAYVAWIALLRARRELSAVQRWRDEAGRRAHVEETLRQAQKLEALGHLTGGVAHDFNNLLMVVNSNVQLLRLEAPSLCDSPRLAALGRAVGAGTKLTRQLLAFSRRQALRTEVIDLHETLPQIIDLVRTTLGRTVDVEGRAAADVAAIEVDRSELELALLNLAINARDAMADAGCTVTRLVVLARNAQPGEFPDVAPRRYIAIDVSDTGPGVAPEVLPHVFEPFYTTKAPGRGTGLGLSQVYGFAVQAGGTARIASIVDLGTTVTIALPVSTKVAEPAVPQPAVWPAPLNARVLLVEDNDDVAEATVALLERIGAQVERLSSAADALQAIRDDLLPIDVVVTDVVMPGTMDGIDLALALRERRPELGVVLMTGYTSLLNRALAAGFEVLPKPVSPQTLSSAIAKASRARSNVR